MTNKPKISIVIPLYVIVDRFFSDLIKFKDLNYKNYEILVVSDKKVDIKNPKVKLILTGKKNTGPAEKRDLALKYLSGDICAFIDDDAYPDKDWLKQISKTLEDNTIVAVGGPGITPSEDSYLAKLGGYVYESLLTSGGAQDRFISKKRERILFDWPAYNLAVRTKDLKQVGGYGNSFYGGEDTLLCLKLIRRGKRIIYNPDMIVYHHRRELFLPHLRQIFNVGIHRGYFAKIYPETSRKFFYYIPSLLTGGFIVLALLSINILFIRYIFLLIFLFLFMLAVISVFRRTTILNAIIVSTGIIATHLTYGIGFVKGLFTKKLTR